VAAASFGKAANQYLVARVEKHDARRDAGGFELAQLRRQRGDRGAAAHIDGHRETLLAFTAQVSHQLEQQRRGQIVDAVVAGIFQHVEGDGFAGTGQAADQDDLHGKEG
jgi:hypothetical protein